MWGLLDFSVSCKDDQAVIDANKLYSLEYHTDVLASI